MHDSSYQLCQKFVNAYAPFTQMKIADVGSQDVNGTYRSLFPDSQYTGFDICSGPGVDVVIESNDEWNLTDEQKNSYDVVISGQVLEHVQRPWIWIRNVAQLCKPGGIIWICAPNSWDFHEFPIDCWRVWPDGMRALFEDAGLCILDCFFEGPDTVGIGRKGILNETNN